MIRNEINRLLYALFPRRCDLCGEVVTPDVGRCDACSGARRVTGKTCPHCGKSKDDCRCKDSAYNKPRYNAAFAPYYYEGSISFGIRRMKLHGYRELTDGMAKEMYEYFDDHCDEHIDIVTYVPISPRRERTRGYNQARLLAEKVASRLELPVVPTLKKIVNTDSQRTKPGYKRRGNVFGVFDLIDGVDVDGKAVLLVDDVKTTGATLSECADMLKIYGAKNVYVLTFAIR